MSSQIPPNVVGGIPRLILLAEGAALLGAASAGFAATEGSWLLFAVLFLAPDIGMLGYLRSPRIGALTYNLVHTTILPLALAVAGWMLASEGMIQIGLIWLAHIGFDRMLGYGLKYGSAFQHTHLGGGQGATSA